MPLLEADKLGKLFHTNGNFLHALKDLSVGISSGEVTSIVGPSGCGKTTFLRIAAGLITAEEGQISISGKSPRDYRVDSKIGFVFQRPFLFPWRNVTQNVLLPTEISRNENTAEADFSQARDLLNLVGLKGFENFYPNQLSGGMLQRAAIARALMTEPKLLFMDEPFSAVDEFTRENLWFDFRKIWKARHLTVILVTHSIREAVYLSDRVLVMSNRPGKIADDYKIALPEPRDATTISLPQFYQIYLKIREEIAEFPDNSQEQDV